MFNYNGTFTKDKTHIEEQSPVFKIEYENYKLKDIVTYAVDTLELKDNRTKAFITFTGVAFITLASKVPMSRLSNLESDILKSDALSGMQMFTGANYQIPTLFSLGIAPVISAGVLLNLLKKMMPSLEDNLNEVYNKEKVRVIKRGLTFLIGLAQGLVLSSINGGGVLIAVTMAVGACLMGVITDYMTDHGLLSGTNAVVGSNIISQLASGGIKSLALTPIMLAPFLRLQSSHVRVATTNKKGTKGYIPFKVFSTGTFPIVLASSVVSIVAFFVPGLMLKFRPLVAMIQAIAVYLLNYCENRVNFNTTNIEKDLRMRSIGIVNRQSKERPKEVLDETVSSISSLSGVVLAVMAALPIAFGAVSFVNISSLFLLSGIIYELIIKFKSESAMTKQRGFLVK